MKNIYQGQKEFIKISLVIILVLLGVRANSQNITITDKETYEADKSAMLDVMSESKGLLIPRLKTTQREAITSPAKGLLVYDIDEKSFYYFDGSDWLSLSQVNSSGTGSALFAVKNSNGDTVFAVYEDGARVFVPEGAKGKVGGFAVSGRSPTKGESNILVVTPDSTRIFVNDTISAKGKVGGFAISGRSPTKGFSNEYLLITGDSTRLYVNDSTKTKGKAGGFAVSGRSPTKGATGDYMKVTRDSTRVYVTEDLGKGKVGGFAISGRSPTKGITGDYFNVSGNLAADVVNNEKRIMWYPKKAALLAGEVHVGSADSVGTNSIAMGYRSISMGDYSQAFGYNTKAIGSNSTAIGNNATANNLNSFALGDDAYAGGDNSYAFGNSASTSGSNSFAFGTGAEGNGNNSLAFGNYTNASNTYATAMGYSSNASGYASMAAGRQSTASNYYAIAMGYLSVASGYASVATGRGTKATNSYATALGYYSEANGIGSFAAGYQSKAIDNYSIALGRGSIADSTYASAMGYLANAKGYASYAAGYSSNANADYSIALGRESTAAGLASYAAGYAATASGDYSISIGRSNSSTGEYAMAMGKDIVNSGDYSIAFGLADTVTGDNGIVLGKGNYLNAAWGGGIAMGNDNIVNSFLGYGTALGVGNEVMAVGPVGAFGMNNYGYAVNSFVFGMNGRIGSESGGTLVNGSVLFNLGGISTPTNTVLDDGVFSIMGANLGVGTVSPSANLHLYGNGDITAIIQADANNSGEDNNPRLELKQDGTLVTGALGFTGDAGVLYTNTLSNSMYLFNDYNSSLHFGTNSTLRMTIESDGDVGIGTNNPAYKLDVSESTTGYIARFTGAGGEFSDGLIIKTGHIYASGSGYDDIIYLNCQDGNGSWVGSIYSSNGSLLMNGKSASTAKNSDIKNTNSGLNIINQLNVVDYDFNSKTNTYKTGFVGEEVNKIFPVMATYQDDIGEYGVANSALVPVLTKAIQEQQQQIDLQQQQINMLIQEIENLKNK